MKIRTDFVSNSSSSSFIVMDDYRINDCKLRLPETYTLETVIEEYILDHLSDLVYNPDKDSFTFDEKYRNMTIFEVSADDFLTLFEANEQVGYGKCVYIPDFIHNTLIRYVNSRKKYNELHMKLWNVSEEEAKLIRPELASITSEFTNARSELITTISDIIRSYRPNISFVGVTIDNSDYERRDEYIDEFVKCNAWYMSMEG